MSNGLLLAGQVYDESLNIVKEFNQQMLDLPSFGAVEGNNAIEGIPNDGGSVQTKTWNLAQIQAALAGIIIAYDELISLDLPDVMTSANVVYNTSYADGSSSQSGTGGSAGQYATLALSIAGSAQASGSLQPDLQWSMKIYPKSFIVGHIRTFFVQSPSTIASILSELSGPLFFNETVTLIPLFQKSVVTVSLLGEQASVSANASVQERVEISQSNVSKTTGEGTGTNASQGVSNRTIQLPACLNPGFSIAGTSSASITATAEADIAGGTNWTALTQTQTNGPITVGASVGPDIPATPQTDIPASGLILTGLTISPLTGFGLNMARAIVVDFAQFAT